MVITEAGGLEQVQKRAVQELGLEWQLNPDGITRHWAALSKHGAIQHITLLAQAHSMTTPHVVESGDMKFGDTHFRLQLSHKWWCHYGVQRCVMEGTLEQEGTWVLPAHEWYAMQRCVMRARVWKRADGGIGKKSSLASASLREKPEEGFREWVTAWGIHTDDVWWIYLQCTIRHTQGYTISSAHLTPAEPTPPLTYTTSIWKGMPKILSLGGGQGRSR